MRLAVTLRDSSRGGFASSRRLDCVGSQAMPICAPSLRRRSCGWRSRSGILHAALPHHEGWIAWVLKLCPFARAVASSTLMRLAVTLRDSSRGGFASSRRPHCADSHARLFARAVASSTLMRLAVALRDSARGGCVVFRVAVDCSKFQSASLYKGRRFAFIPHCLKKSSTRKSAGVQVQRDRTHGFATRRRAKNENRAFYSAALSVMPLASRCLLFFSFPGSAFAALIPQPTIRARRERRTA